MKKIILLLSLILVSFEVLSQTSGSLYPGDPFFEICIQSRKAEAERDAARFSTPENPVYVVSRDRIEDRDIYRAIYVEFATTSPGFDPRFLVWRYSCEHREYMNTAYSTASSVVSSLQKDKLPPSEVRCSKAKGSIIDYNKGTVLESIPIEGTALSLVYNSEYNQQVENNKRLEVSYSFLQSKGYSHRLRVLNESNELLDTVFYSNLFNFANYSKVVNFTQALQEESEFLSKYKYKVVIDRSLTLATPTSEDPEHADQYWLPLNYGDEKDILLYKPEVWGLSGWTLSSHHYFHAGSKTLFTGYGEVISYDKFKSITLPPYGLVNVVIEKNTVEEIYIFDSLGRHLETRDTTWNKPIFKFSYNGNKIVKITDRFNLETIINYDVDGKVASIKSPYALVTNFVLSNGKIEQVINPLNRLHKMTYGLKNEMLTFEASNDVITTFVYSADGGLVKEVKNNGIVQSFSAEFVGISKNLHHKLNNFFKSHQKTELPSAYTADNTALGTETSEYDSENRLISKSSFYPLQSRKVTTSSEEIVNTQINYSSEWTSSVSFERLLNRQIPLLGSDFNENTRESTTWVSISEQDLSAQLRVVSFTQGNRSKQFSFSNVNKTINYTDSDNNQSTMKVNEIGLPLEISDRNMPTKYLSYDSNFRLIKVQSGTQSESYSYDQYGYLSQITNSKGQITTFDRNILGQVLKKTLPNGDSILFEYSNGNAIKKMTLPNGEVHNFSYGLGEYLASYLTPGNKNTFYEYDSDKRLTQTTKPSGKTIKYNYKTESSNLASIESSTGIRTYNLIDENGRVRDINSEDNIRLKMNWIAGQLKEQILYDSDGSLIGTLANGFRKDQLRVNSIKLNGQEFASYSGDIDAPSLINNKITCTRNTTDIGVNCSNGFSTSIVKSTDDNVIKLNATFIKIVGQQDTSNYENTRLDISKAVNFFGEVISHSEKMESRVDYGPSERDFYNKEISLTPNYDANSRMTGVVTNKDILLNSTTNISSEAVTNSYSYPLSSNNNVKEYKSNSKRTLASHNNDDQLIKLTGSVNKDYQYTDDGDLKSFTNCYGTTTFDYDTFGNLKKVVLPTGKVIEYKVDGLNRRVKKLVNGQVIEYYLWYDQIHLAAVLDANKQAKVKYIYTIDSSSASLIEKDGMLFKIVHDPGLGSVRYVANIETKEVVQEIEYDELGNMVYNSNKDFQPLGYAGGLFDSDTGLTRFGARDYDPKIGRWTTKDPIGFMGGDTNLYSYVGANPLSYIDPSGLVGLEIGGGLAAQLGLPGASAGKNWAFSFDFSTGQWQTGTTTTVQARAGGGAYLGAGLNISVTPLASSVCDLGGHSGGIGGDAGVGLVGGGVQLGWGSAGPIISGSRWGVGAGVTGYGFYNYSSAQVTNQGNLYQMLGFGK